MKRTMIFFLALALSLGVFSCTRFGSRDSKEAKPSPKGPSISRDAARPTPLREENAEGESPEVSFTLDQDTIAEGEAPVVTFSQPLAPKEGERYWMAVVDAEAGASEIGERQFLDVGAESVELKVPEGPGTYQVRLHDGYPAREYHSVFQRMLTVEGSAHSGPAIALVMPVQPSDNEVTREVRESWDSGEPRVINFYRGRGDGRELVRVETYYEDGQIQEQVNYKNGARQGAYQEWYESGRVRVEATYQDGVKQGRYTVYREEGSVLCEGNLENGSGRIEYLDEYGNHDRYEDFHDGG